MQSGRQSSLRWRIFRDPHSLFVRFPKQVIFLSLPIQSTSQISALQLSDTWVALATYLVLGDYDMERIFLARG
jgi:hypothetical protein